MNRNGKPMTATEAADMATVLAMPPRPSSAARMPPAPLKVRLKTSPLLRRALPTPLVLHRAARRADALWRRSPEARRDATSVMAAIVTGTERSQEIEELAREYLSEQAVQEAYCWQPWPTPTIDPTSRARVRDALAQGRGVLLSACHLGPFFMAVPAISTMGVVPFTVAGPWFFEEPSHDRWGRRLALWQKRSASRMILSTGSFPILSALLSRGEAVYLFFDMPGPRETRFLGKTAMLADGTARLAKQTGALVLALRTRSNGHRVSLDVAAPIDPREFTGAEDLHGALADRHERWILEAPAAMSDPRTFGWGDYAAPAGWARPARPERSSPAAELAAT
jgi:lauroyl/myristoyl acyltransferase